MTKPFKELPPVVKKGKDGGIGDKVENVGQRILTWIWNTTHHLVVDLLAAAVTLCLEVLEKAAAPLARPILDEIVNAEGITPGIKAYFEELRSPTSQAAALGLTGMLGGMGMTAAGGLLAPLSRQLNYVLDRAFLTGREDPSLSMALRWRDSGHAKTYHGRLNDLGYVGWVQDAMAEVYRPRPSPGELIAAEYRSGLKEKAVDAELEARGITDEDIKRIRLIAKLIPGPADLVRMAVREAWRDDVAQAYGYDDDWPPEFGKWMEKHGDEDEWAKKYWRAHWDLPGLTTVLEILHRVPNLPPGYLEDYLRTADIPSTWRNYIKQIAYAPLTRVDVRRMYGLGVLDRDEVKRNYLDLGYNDRDAERMTEFTVKYETEEDREATKSDILSFYNAGSLSQEEAIDWLNRIGYNTELATYLVMREATKAAQKQVDESVKYIQDKYIRGDLDVAQTTTQLGALGLSSGEIERKLNTWDITKEAKVERPTRATLDKLFTQDVITVDDYTSGLDAIGYQQKYVGWYLESVLLAKTEASRKEEEAARKEQDDIRLRKVKSDYQIAKAGIDVDIAELQTAVADTQLALQSRKSRYQEERSIATSALTVAQLETQAASDIDDYTSDINTLHEAIAQFNGQVEAAQTRVAEIKLAQTRVPPLYSPETADRLIKEQGVVIEQAQDDIAGAELTIRELQSAISARRAKLQKDIGIVGRIRTIEEIDRDYRADLDTMTTKLSGLHINLAELRENKALLEVAYREGIAPAD